MGSLTKLLYNAKRRLANVFSVKLTNNDNLKNEKIDCINNIPSKLNAIKLACDLSLLLTQSTSKPINFGKANAVPPVSNKKNKPI